MARPSYYCFAAYLLGSLTLRFAATLGTSAELTQDNQWKLGNANNKLAVDLLHQIRSGSSDNIFFSPFSLSTAFGMLYYGTKGKTAKELRKVLGYETANITDELVHQTFQQYLTETLPSQDSSAYVLKSANAIFLDKTLTLVPTYKDDVQRLYQASVEDVDFVSDTSQAVKKVNGWVNKKTNGKIDKLLDKLDPTTVLVLLNAIYFKGTWKTQFNPSLTRSGSFYNNGLKAGAKKVPLMSIIDHFAYFSDEEFQAVELPYKGENISMIVLLPREPNGLESLMKSLTLERFADVRRQLHRTEVELIIPKFKIEYTREMSEDFRAIGAKDVFEPGADFSGLTTDYNVVVSQVIHKAVLEVNEEGSEAAAATAIVFFKLSASTNPLTIFHADHPFMFLIVDKRCDMVLFLGKVTDL